MFFKRVRRYLLYGDVQQIKGLFERADSRLLLRSKRSLTMEKQKN